MNHNNLPPLVGGFLDGNVTWQRIESIDFDTLGYLLSCHLIIEHYVDHFLATHPGANFGWKNARLTFAQKIALVSGLKFTEPYNFPPVIKHLNTLRNRFGHNINAKLTEEDLLPIRSFLEGCTGNDRTIGAIPTEPKAIIGMFTFLTCAYFAGVLARRAEFESS
jgi:hypothetical protein